MRASKIEVLDGQYDDGSFAKVIKRTPPMPGYPNEDGLPDFRLESGDRLTPHPDDTEGTVLLVLATQRRLRLVRHL